MIPVGGGGVAPSHFNCVICTMFHIDGRGEDRQIGASTGLETVQFTVSPLPLPNLISCVDAWMGSPNLVKILRGSKHASPASDGRNYAILSPSCGSANSACPLRSLRCLHAEMHKSSSGSKSERMDRWTFTLSRCTLIPLTLSLSSHPLGPPSVGMRSHFKLGLSAVVPYR